MRMQREASPVRRLYEAIGALVGVAALTLQLVLLLRISAAAGATPVAAVASFFSYFTILSNVLVVASYLGSWRAPQRALGRFLDGAQFKTAVALYITVVALVYLVILRPLWNPQGLAKLADVSLHYVAPLLYLAYWLLLADKSRLRYGDVAAWLVFPILYCVYALVRGGLIGVYPYPFLEADKIGYAHVAANIGVLVVLFALIGFVLVAVARGLARAQKSEDRGQRTE